MGIGSEIYIITMTKRHDFYSDPDTILCPYADYETARKEFDEQKADLIESWTAYGYTVEVEPDYIIATHKDGFYACFEFKVENIH